MTQQSPITGKRLFDTDYVGPQGLAGGNNFQGQSGITATATGTQANAYALNPNVMCHQVSVCVTNGDSVKLPPALQGMVKFIANAGAATLSVYGANATDTINGTAGSTPFSMTTGKNAMLFSPKDGVWNVVLTA